MKKVPLEKLPEYSPWPARLLGLDVFEKEERTVEKVLREYDTDKFGTWLKESKESKLTLEQVKSLERGRSSGDTMCFSRYNDLFEATVQDAFAQEEKLFVEKLEKAMFDCDTVVELGAGYGPKLATLKKHFSDYEYIGGELTENGRELGSLVNQGVTLVPFNFYDKTWEIFEQLAGKKCLVFTYHSVSMLPDANLFVDMLYQYADRVVHVFLFEALYELAPKDSLLGLMRRGYISMNNYGENIYSAVTKSKKVKAQSVEYDMFGANPLFPESPLHFKFN